MATPETPGVAARDRKRERETRKALGNIADSLTANVLILAGLAAAAPFGGLVETMAVFGGFVEDDAPGGPLAELIEDDAPAAAPAAAAAPGGLVEGGALGGLVEDEGCGCPLAAGGAEAGDEADGAEDGGAADGVAAAGGAEAGGAVALAVGGDASAVEVGGLDASQCQRRTDGAPCASPAAVADVRRLAAEAAGAKAGAGRGPRPAATPVGPDVAAVPRDLSSEIAALGCDGEACAVQRAAEAGSAAAARDLASRFKPAGPRRTTALLSNFDIDGVLARWAAEFPRFRHCGYAMMDFAATGGELARADLARAFGPAEAPGRYDTFACVLNTDVSTGPGKHWVAVFADARAANAGAANAGNHADTRAAPVTVEYFNSAGNAPTREAAAWQAAQVARLEAAGRPARAVDGGGVVHQRSQTECGLYALYYIRRRLEGAPPAAFAERVPDRLMTEFRQYCFR